MWTAPLMMQAAALGFSGSGLRDGPAVFFFSFFLQAQNGEELLVVQRKPLGCARADGKVAGSERSTSFISISLPFVTTNTSISLDQL